MQLPKLFFLKAKKLPEPRAPSLFSKIKSYGAKILQRLNTPQKLYLLAFSLLFFYDINWPLLCLIILIGLAMEFWPRFNQLWHSLLGKSFLLFCYAIVANFALASAASVINDITGVAAEHLPYSHNFAILLYLPIWFIGFTFFALILLQLFTPFYLLALLLLKPFGIRASKILSQGYYPFITSVVRMVLASIVVAQFYQLNESEFRAANNQLQHIFLPDKEQEKKKELENKEKPTQNSLELGAAASELDRAEDEPTTQFTYQEFAIASLNKFIYELESDEFSRCKISPQARIIELNDYEILEITLDKEQAHLYHYQVKKCISVAIEKGTRTKSGDRPGW